MNRVLNYFPDRVFDLKARNSLFMIDKRKLLELLSYSLSIDETSHL